MRSVCRPDPSPRPLVYSPAAALTDPFSTSGSFGQTRNLTELRHTTLNLAHTFTYGYGSELASATNPHGGTLSWTHVTHIFANSRGIREIGARTGPAGTHQFVRDASDSGRPFHPYTKLMDPDGQTDRYYRFDNTSTNQPHYGYISQIEHTQRATGAVRLREAFTWAQDTLTPQPRSYVGTATTTYDPAG
ncbi:MAG: hypothetical protein JNN08_25075, partial [Bryobacterales bacterium]|nr:hypothetical protein [Bryobacterales bacterium]